MIKKLVIILALIRAKEKKTIQLIRRRVEEAGRRQGVQGVTEIEETEDDHRVILVLALHLTDAGADLETNESGKILEINTMIEIIDIEKTNKSHGSIGGTVDTVAIARSTESARKRD